MTRISAAVIAGTVPRSPGRATPPARFAMEVRTDQDQDAVASAVTAAFDDLDVTVSVEYGLLILEFPDRTLVGADDAAAFGAAYALADEFDGVAAEPDLPTAFFPEGDAVPEDPGLAAIPGCQVGPEPALEDQKRWALNAIGAVAAWDYSARRGHPVGGAGIVVAQPDTGVTQHRELVGVDRAAGYDMVDDDADPTDPLTGLNKGHGTGTASVVVSPSSLEIAGSAPHARHMPIRAIQAVVRVTQVTVARSIDWAVAHGAHVITMSLGGIPSFSLSRALRRAVDADVIVLAAAGNCVRTVVWPARYDDCIAVAGTNAADGQWPGTCRGPAVDISAPAQNVFRATLPSGVGQGEGTSFAVALTAGVAALWLAHHGRASLIATAHAQGETLQVMFRRLLQETARLPAQWNPADMGPGIVDAVGLLSADLDLPRERGSTPPTMDPRDAEARSINSLIAEVVGPQAIDESLDVHMFGPELVAAILGRRVGPQLTGEVAIPEASPELVAAVANPALRDWLGLDA